VLRLFAGAASSRAGEGRLDTDIPVSTHPRSWFGILLALQRSANAGIERAGPVGRNTDNPAKGSDRKARYLSHFDFTQCSTS